MVFLCVSSVFLMPQTVLVLAPGVAAPALGMCPPGLFGAASTGGGLGPMDVRVIFCGCPRGGVFGIPPHTDVVSPDYV